MKLKNSVFKGQLARYSTYSGNSSNIYDVNNNLFKSPIIFSSLEQACEIIKFKYIGVAGVYKLTNKKKFE